MQRRLTDGLYDDNRFFPPPAYPPQGLAAAALATTSAHPSSDVVCYSPTQKHSHLRAASCRTHPSPVNLEQPMQPPRFPTDSPERARERTRVSSLLTSRNRKTSSNGKMAAKNRHSRAKSDPFLLQIKRGINSKY